MSNKLHKPTFFVGCDLRRLDQFASQANPYIGDVGHWPEHITLIPPVAEREDKSPEEVFWEFREIGKRTEQITVQPIRDARFGENGEVPVTVVEDLRLLHFALIGVLHAYGYDGRYPEEFTGKHYNAHVSRRPGEQPLESAIILSSMSIFRRKNDVRRSIEERILFSRR